MSTSDDNTVVRSTIPYARHSQISTADVQMVTDALMSDHLTGGKYVQRFEKELSALTDGEAIAVNSGTAALHTAMHVMHLGKGDKVLVPALAGKSRH